MASTITKTASQLLREFWIPCVASIVWTSFVLWDKDLTAQAVGSNFGGAFFFTSWMTGQFFRVRKQAGVENSLSKVEARVLAITDRLEKSTEELVGHMTGGEGSIQINVLINDFGYTDWMAVHLGTSPYTMYNVSVRITDEDLLGRTLALPDAVEIGDMTIGTALKVHSVDLGNEDSRRFHVYIIARNGHASQLLRFRKVNNVWLQASKYEGSHGPVRLVVDEGYPRNDNGEVDWS